MVRPIQAGRRSPIANMTAATNNSVAGIKPNRLKMCIRDRYSGDADAGVLGHVF